MDDIAAKGSQGSFAVCPRCQHNIAHGFQICQHCGHSVTADQQRALQKTLRNHMLRAFVVGLVIIAAVYGLAAFWLGAS